MIRRVGLVTTDSDSQVSSYLRTLLCCLFRVRAEGSAAGADRVSAAAGHRSRREARRKRGRPSVHRPDAQHRQVGSRGSAEGRGVRAHRTAAGAGRFPEVRHLVASVDIKQPKTAEELKAEEARRRRNGARVRQVPGAENATGAPSQRQAEREGGPKLTSSRDGLIERARGVDAPSTWRLARCRRRGHCRSRPKRRPVVVEKIETPGTVNFDWPPQRFYTIVGVSESRNRRGPFAGPIAVTLLEPLSPPEKLDLAYTADAVSLTWPGQPEDVVAAGATVKGAPGGDGACNRCTGCSDGRNGCTPVPPAAPAGSRRRPVPPLDLQRPRAPSSYTPMSKLRRPRMCLPP